MMIRERPLCDIPCIGRRIYKMERTTYSPKSARKIRRGFSLVETMVSASLLAVVMTGVVSLYVMGSQNFTAGIASLSVHSDARLTMDYIARDIRWAASATVSGTSGSNTLTLAVPSLDSSGNVSDPDADSVYNDDTIIYRRNASDAAQLERVVTPGTGSYRPGETRTLAKNIDYLYFNIDSANPKEVAAEVRTKKTTFGGRNPATETLSSTIKMRNKT